MFYNYTERKDFQTPSRILAKQVANLETATKKLTTKSHKLTFAKAVWSSTTPSIPSIPSSFLALSSSATAPTVRSSAALPSPTCAYSPSEWITVGDKGKRDAGRGEESKSRKDRNGPKLVFSLANKEKEIQPLQLHDQINKGLQSRGAQNPSVSAVSKS